MALRGWLKSSVRIENMDTCRPGLIGFLRLKVGTGNMAVIRRPDRRARKTQQFKLASVTLA